MNTTNTWLERVLNTGVERTTDPRTRKSVVLTNTLTLVIICCGLLSLGYWLYSEFTADFPNLTAIFFVCQSFLVVLVFVVPFVLNKVGQYSVAKFYISYAPVLIVWYLLIDFTGQKVDPAVLDGIRYFLLAIACIPFLIIEPNKVAHLLLGGLPVCVSIIFFDRIVGLVAPSVDSLSSEFHLNSFTSFIAYLVFAGCCYALKRSTWTNEVRNDELIKELTKKNKVISEQAQGDVRRLNKDLQAHVSALTHREMLLKKSQQIAKIGSWEYMLADGRLTWSDQTYEIFGLDRSFDLRTPNLNTILFGQASHLMEEAFNRLVSDKEPYDLTTRVVTPIGYKKWVRVTGFPSIVNDETVAASGIVHDVTYYKEAEEQLRGSEGRYRNLFEQASDAILIHDFEGRLLDVNQSMCNLFGYAKEELLMMKINELMDPDDIENNPLKIEQVASGERVFSERTMIAKDGTRISIESNVRRFAENQAMAIVRDISVRKQIEQEKEHTRHLLRERIKELTALNQVSNILSQEIQKLDEIVSAIVEALPPGWQYPEICAAKISLFGKIYKTSNYRESDAMISSLIRVDKRAVGHIHVCYVEEVAGEDGDPFLPEEQNLLDTIADMLQIYITRKQDEEARDRSEANLVATINNTGIFIWSVDPSYKVLTFNEPFYKYMLKRYDVKVEVGKEVLDNMNPPDEEFKGRWDKRYARALAGETYSLEETRGDFDFKYSFNPIKRYGETIGVSVVAEDVTERNARERELAEAIQKISDLQLMALRSVMNPHFIFNALNSIQYFITKNDRVNAISYLSTFAKLVRGILTSSVDKTIKLSKELELLQHYISLEQLRFENKFDFELQVDPDLDTDTVEIPSLLIQPYVENAIIHGLYNKKGPGNLKIRVVDKEEAIVLEVEDDGVGRVEARKIRATSFPQHRSMGMYVTEERLQLINQNADHVSVEFDDLYNGEAPSGTRVRIWISNENS